MSAREGRRGNGGKRTDRVSTDDKPNDPVNLRPPPASEVEWLAVTRHPVGGTKPNCKARGTVVRAQLFHRARELASRQLGVAPEFITLAPRDEGSK